MKVYVFYVIYRDATAMILEVNKMDSEEATARLEKLQRVLLHEITTMKSVNMQQMEVE